VKLIVMAEEIQNKPHDRELPNNKRPLVEGEDYYWEGQYMVFTARFLLQRGFCCESGCRHCPYDRE